MYLVKVVNRDNNEEILGTSLGQGFYPYKKTNTVVRKLYERTRHLPQQYKVGYYYYYVYQGATNETNGQLVVTLQIQ